MRFELGRLGVRPICEIHEHAHLAGYRFHDIEAVVIEEVGVIAEYLIELRRQRMVGRASTSSWLTALTTCAELSFIAYSSCLQSCAPQ
jgi:hypothetical protein